MARLDRLAAAKEVAQLGATLSREFSYSLLQAVSDLDQETLQRALARLVEAEMLYQRGLPPRATYLFKHALIQDAAYQSLLRSVRQRYHQRVAITLVDRFREDADARPEFVAHHYTESGLAAEAVPWWQKAAQRAMQRSAHAEALVHCRKGLEMLATIPESTVRDRLEMDLQITLANALIHAKGWSADETGAVFARATELCRSVDDVAVNFRVVLGHWSFHYLRGDLRNARRYAAQCLEIAQSAQDDDLLINAHTMTGNTLGAIGQLASARLHLETALEIYGVEYQPQHIARFGRDPRISALQWLTYMSWAMGYPDRALDYSMQALRFAEQINHPFSIAWGLMALGSIRVFRRDHQGPDGPSARGSALSAEQGFPLWLGYGQFMQGMDLILGNDLEAGARLLRSGEAIFRATGSGLNLTLVHGFLACAHLALGVLEAASAAVNAGLACADRNDEHWAEAELHRIGGEVALAKGDAAGAEACFSKSLALAREQQAKSWELRAAASYARLMRDRGRTSEAAALLEPVYEWFTEGFDTKDLQEAKALLAQLRR
jgi:predicted ATPase